MKERPILFSGEMVRAILEGRKTQTRRVVKPTQSTPKVAPLTMYPYMYDGQWQEDDDGLPCWIGEHPDYPHEGKWFSCPYGGIGDRLWVRETFNRLWFNADDGWQTFYRADMNNDGPADGSADLESIRWRPSIFMPRALSRITLTITDVRVERVQDIGEADAKAEGIQQRKYAMWTGRVTLPDGRQSTMQMLADPDNPGEPPEEFDGAYIETWTTPETHRIGYAQLWNSINAKRGYDWDTNPWVWVISFEVKR